MRCSPCTPPTRQRRSWCTAARPAGLTRSRTSFRVTGSTRTCRNRSPSKKSRRCSMIFENAAEPLPILVVDDDSALIRTLADILKMHGYSPATAATGREGLALAADREPALAVVDLRLPDMDGMELASRLHEL